jgi:Dolichyl-phosphate-mannose-protein mannosyltransferase
MIFPLLFVAVYLSHITLLRLPYYWDEAGYYIPAAFDFFRTGSLIPSTTLSNAHPPLPSLYLALWWKASGFMPAVTRTAMCLVTAVALLGVYRLSSLLTVRPQVAAATTLLTLLYPVWFAQSTLAHADMFAAAGTLWGLVFVFAELRAGDSEGGGSAARAAACFALAALCKETAIVTPLAIALWMGYQAVRSANPNWRRSLRLGLWLLTPLLPLLGWYAYHRYRTGYIFGNPQFVRYNATSTLTPLRILVALAHRVMQLTAHMNLFVPVLCTIGSMLLVPLMERDGSERPRIARADQAILYVVLLANLIFFSVIGGALLTRYLLPLYPLVLLICVSTLRRRVPYWWALVGLSAGAFFIGLTVNPPYRFAPEDNLNYADVIRLQQQAIAQIQAHFPNSTVLTAWPATDELTRPELGYVKKPIPVVGIANFSLPEIEKAAASNRNYSVCLAFSTKYDPPRLFSLGARNEALDTRFFDFHRDLEPSAIAHLLHGTVFWRGERNGEWAAVLHFEPRQTPGAQLAAVQSR